MFERREQHLPDSTLTQMESRDCGRPTVEKKKDIMRVGVARRVVRPPLKYRPKAEQGPGRKGATHAEGKNLGENASL